MGFRERVAERFRLPKDLVMGAAVLTVTGRSEAYVENYRGIIEYTEERIRLQTKTCQMTLCGEGLHIDYYMEDEMKISGRIGEIRYC
ncbi:MAG: YabP/YqfC family sporulation protein [Lachnospiraceae bacterium]|nr:YabP/YqfC family sporulation protein [Lachnospiraceae bacterium]